MSEKYALGLHEVADGCHAYLQPDGSWGWSNAGLIVGDGASLLVDTLFDLHLTRRMLDSMTPITLASPIAQVVNTHANGDHCFGNVLVDQAEIIATSATAREMAEVPPSLLAGLNNAAGEVGDMFRSFFGEFQFDGIELRLPDRTFDGRVDLEVGGRSVELIEVGPAHTQGDTLAYVPDLMLGMDIDVVVPGHGPVTDKAGVVSVRDYLSFVDDAAGRRHAAGLDAWDATREIAAEIRARADFNSLGEFGRIAVNVDTVYRHLDPAYTSANVVEQFRRMALLESGPPESLH